MGGVGVDYRGRLKGGVNKWKEVSVLQDFSVLLADWCRYCWGTVPLGGVQ